MSAQPSMQRRQQGMVLLVSLVMMVMITLMVVSAFRVSSGNLQMVGNVQFRTQALAAADVAIERLISVPVIPSAGQVEPVDIDRDGTPEYSVTVVRSCLQAIPVPGSSGAGGGSSVTLPGFSGDTKEYLALLDFDATITDVTTGTAVRLRKGLQARLNQARCDSICPPAPTAPCN